MIRPIGDRVLVKMDEVEEKTKSGIILSESDKERPQFSTVINVGDKIDGKVNIGDRILTSKYAGIEAKYDGVKYLVVKIDDVIAKVEEE